MEYKPLIVFWASSTNLLRVASSPSLIKGNLALFFSTYSNTVTEKHQYARKISPYLQHPSVLSNPCPLFASPWQELQHIRNGKLMHQILLFLKSLNSVFTEVSEFFIKSWNLSCRTLIFSIWLLTLLQRINAIKNNESIKLTLSQNKMDPHQILTYLAKVLCLLLRRQIYLSYTVPRQYYVEVCLLLRSFQNQIPFEG